MSRARGLSLVVIVAVSTALAGCTSPASNEQPLASIRDVRAVATLGEECEREGVPYASCVIATMLASGLDFDERPLWCGNWYGLTAQNNTFPCLDAEAEWHGGEVATLEIRVHLLFPEDERDATMERLVYLGQRSRDGPMNLTVEWVPPPQG